MEIQFSSGCSNSGNTVSCTISDMLGFGYQAHWKQIKKQQLFVSSFSQRYNGIAVRYVPNIFISLKHDERYMKASCVLKLSFHNTFANTELVTNEMKGKNMLSGLIYHGKIHYAPFKKGTYKNMTSNEVKSICFQHNEGIPFSYQSQSELYTVSAFLKEMGYIQKPTVIVTSKSGISQVKEILSREI